MDINPFLVWLGNLKLRAYQAAIVEELLAAARYCSSNLHHSEKTARIWVPDLYQIEKWWDPPVLHVLALLLTNIEGLGNNDEEPPIVDLLKVAFCRTLIETSHASFGHQSMSFKKRASMNQKLLLDEDRVSDALTAVRWRFLSATDELAESLISEQPLAKARVCLGDSRDLEKVLPARGYTVVVTSPPYPNRMSYIRELRPYMYWLRFLKNGREAGELDWTAIGGTWGCATSNLATWEGSQEQKIPYPKFDRIVSTICQDHVLLGRYVHKYFQDIQVHLRSLGRVLAPGARCYYIVGNSKFYGTLLPVEDIYASMFEDTGFIHVRTERLRKRNSKKELFEYVVYAEKPQAQ